jgi:hypothetical protein
MAPVAIAVDARNKHDLMRFHWFGAAIESSAFMHSLLCTIALHQYYVGRGSVDAIFYHKAEAIASVNSALLDKDLKVAVSDANIGAVFNLLCVEENLNSAIFDKKKPDNEQPGQRAMHLNGMRRMIQMRGGLMEIKTNRVLQAFILWCVQSLLIVCDQAFTYRATGIPRRMPSRLSKRRILPPVI